MKDELYRSFPVDPKIHLVSLTASKDEVAEIFGVLDFSTKGLQDETRGPIVIEDHN